MPRFYFLFCYHRLEITSCQVTPKALDAILSCVALSVYEHRLLEEARDDSGFVSGHLTFP